MSLSGRHAPLRRAAWWAAALCAIVPSPARAQDIPAPLSRFLRDIIGLPADQIAGLSRGEPAALVLKSSDHREVAVLGVVRLAVSRAVYVGAAGHFPSSLQRPSRIRYGLFSSPAVPADVATVSLSHDDFEDLAQCRVGACRLKLSARAIAALGGRFDPNSPAADSQVTGELRTRMLSIVDDYRAHGNTALLEYVDQSVAESAAVIFDSLLSRSPYLYAYTPSLERYLKQYPEARPDSLQDVVFWSLDDLPGVKPILTITHALIYSPPELPGTTFLAAKQIYADHYLDGGLEVTAVVDASPSACYLVLLRRLHFDDLPSGGLLNIRSRVIGKLREETLTFLRSTRTQIERR